MSIKNFRPQPRKCLALAGLLLGVAFNPLSGVAMKRTEFSGPAKKILPAAIAQPSQEPDPMDQLGRSIRRLTLEVERLAKRVSDLEKERLFDVTRVLLVGEEQRAESLQLRLRENLERQLALQGRLIQVDNQLKPENIERLFVGVGLVRPEEARDTVQRRLSLEKQGLLAQIELVRQERNRFQSALATADVAIQRLRLRLSER